MRKLIVATAVVAGLSFWGSNASSAKASDPFHFGIHIGSYGVHVGHGHGYRVPGYYGGYYRGSPHRSYYPRGGHYHYHPPAVIRHGCRYDYIPGHYDFYPSRRHRYHY